MADHTPAPWFNDFRDVKWKPSPDTIAVTVARVAGSDDEARANVRLIAAAPEYREARLTLFDSIAHGDQEHRDWLKSAIDAHFAAADAKAQGA